MRFLLVSYNYAPEKTGIGKYNGEWAEWLVSSGHQVDVVTSNPYYPEWKIDEAYRRKKWSTERRKNLTIYRVPMYIPGRVTGLTRIVSDLSFAVSSLTAWLRLLWKRKRYDVVIAVCPSMLNGIVPAIYTRMTDSFMQYHVQDLQLDAAVKLNFIKNPLLLKILRGVERFQLTNASMVSSISDGMREKILAKGVDSQKYFMLANWVDVNEIKPLPAGTTRELRAKFGFEDGDRVILYSGNLGEKQGIDVIVEVAGLLQEEKDWKFLICGEGVSKQDLIDAVRAKGLKQVIFAPLQPYNRMAELLNMAEIHLVPQKKAAADLVLPSKLTGILAAGGVSIVACEEGTSLYNLIEDNQIGYTVEPENALQLAEVVRKAMGADNGLIRKSARAFAELNMSKEAILKRFEKYVQERIGGD